MTNLDDFLKEAETVAIAGHIRPDGDCVGSCLATYNYIKTYYPKIEVDLYLEPIPNIFKFLNRAEEIISDCSSDKAYPGLRGRGASWGSGEIFSQRKKDDLYRPPYQQPELCHGKLYFPGGKLYLGIDF